jgi:hypothetical protein
MPLRLNVGVSKKLGLPAYSSIGASCNLEVELDSNLLHDLAGFHTEVRDAFVAARRAVDDELARLQAQADVAEIHGAEAANGHRRDLPVVNGVHAGKKSPAPRPEARPARAGKPATPSQVRAIVSIARRQHADLDGLLCDLGVTRPEELTLADASGLIDQLKAAAQA